MTDIVKPNVMQVRPFLRIVSFFLSLMILGLVFSCAGKDASPTDSDQADGSSVVAEKDSGSPPGDSPAETGQVEDPSPTPPDWYLDRQYSRDQELVLLGYGQGNTRDEARGQALQRIAQKLGVTVRGTQQRVIEEDTNDQEEAIRDEFQSQTTIETRHRIKKFNQVHYESNQDRHYVVIEVDRRPLDQILAERLRDELDSAFPVRSVQWEGPSSLLEGDLFQSIEQNLVEPSNEGSDELPLTVSLERSQGSWILSIGPVNHTLENADFARLLNWETDDPNKLSLELMPEELGRGHNRLLEGDKFYFRVKSNQTSGYFALFNIYSDGRVSVLKGATPLETVQFIPVKSRLEQGERFRAHLIEDGKPTLDVYLAVRSPEEFSTSEFRYLGKNQGIVSGNKSFQVHNLMDWMESKNLNGKTAITVQVLPKSGSIR